MNKISVRQNRAAYIPSEMLSCACAKKGNLLVLSMHRVALQKADSLREQGRRVPCPIKQIATLQTPENRQKERLLLSAPTILHSLRINGCYRKGCFSISGMQQPSTSGQWEQVNEPYLLISERLCIVRFWVSSSGWSHFYKVKWHLTPSIQSIRNGRE